MTVTRRTMLSVAAALLGIAATATVAWSASQLAAPGIGLSAEPCGVELLVRIGKTWGIERFVGWRWWAWWTWRWLAGGKREH